MTAQTYNGWTNYETWNVALWLDNDEGSYLHVRELASEAHDQADEIRTATGLLADALKEMVEELAPDLGASMFADLLGAALSEVNWHEIAEHIASES